MPRQMFALLALVSVLSPLGAQELGGGQKPRAKLAVMLVFDQLRADYLMRYRDLFGQGGFKRFLDQGAWYQEAHYPYAFTVTGPGHASLGTGCTPRVHGILGNDWRDRATGDEIYCATTERVRNIPGALPPSSSQGTKRTGGGSPERMLVPTVSDLLRKQSPQSRVAGFSLKDRGAVLPCGRQGTCVYFWDSSTGLFGTSTYYRDAVAPWVDAFNKGRPSDKWFNGTWDRLRPELDYAKLAGPDDVEGEGPGVERKQGRAFPHPFPTKSADGKPDKTYYSALYNSPFSNEILADLAIRSITEEQLGQRDVTDFLEVSFSANDVVGHCYGPDSQEVLDTLLRSDRILARLFAELDAKVGADNWIAVLSADHGVCPLPELSRTRGDDGAVRVDGPAVFKGLCAHLREKFKLAEKDQPFFGSMDENMYFNPGPFKKVNADMVAVAQAAREYLEKQKGIARVYTRAQIGSLSHPDPIDRMVLESYRPDSSGDLLVVLAPGCLVNTATNSTGTSHGTPYRYDTHVPLLVTGKGVIPGPRAGRVNVLAFGAILAEITGVEPLPQAVPLPEGLFTGR